MAIRRLQCIDHPWLHWSSSLCWDTEFALLNTVWHFNFARLNICDFTVLCNLRKIKLLARIWCFTVMHEPCPRIRLHHWWSVTLLWLGPNNYTMKGKHCTPYKKATNSNLASQRSHWLLSLVNPVLLPRNDTDCQNNNNNNYHAFRNWGTSVTCKDRHI